MNFTLEKKNGKCGWKEVIYITEIYATSQPATQIQQFKNVCGISSGNRQQEIICKPVFCHPHMQRKRCVRKGNMKQRRKTTGKKHSPLPQSC